MKINFDHYNFDYSGIVLYFIFLKYSNSLWMNIFAVKQIFRIINIIYYIIYRYICINCYICMYKKRLKKY